MTITETGHHEQSGGDIFFLIDAQRMDEVKLLVQRNPKLLEAENVCKLTPLMYALLRKNFVVVLWMMMKTTYRFKDTVLIAVLVGDVSIVSSMYQIQRFESAKDPSLLFPAYMTPLMLAALSSNYAMIKVLMRLGATLNIPHRPDCICTNCTESATSKDWVVTNCRRIHEYRAICSHAYLLQECVLDPIIEAFMITRDLEKCQSNDSIYADTYADISNHVRKLPVALLNCCRDDAEVTTLLKQKEGAPRDFQFEFPRLYLALDSKQKEFISDPRCLRIVKKHWLGNWADWELVSPRIRCLRILNHTVLYPITSLMYIVSDGSMPDSYKNPFSRFITFTTSYLVFLMCLIGFAQYKESRVLRGAPDNMIKKAMLLYIWTYMLGMFVVSWTDLMRLGFRRFLYAWWRWYDFLQLVTYFLAFNAYLISWMLVRKHTTRYAHRVHWDPVHPTLLFEVLFTIAAVLSSWRLFYFLQILRSFGPLVISVGRCVRDILIFLLVFFVVVGSFALGLNYLLEHYKYNRVYRGNEWVEQPFFMTSIQSAIRYLYWAWYGYLDPERLTVIVGNYGPKGQEAKHMLVQYAAELLSALYYVVLVVSLLNLMISIMATTAGTILERKDQEWKYVCCQMWSEFFLDSRVLPPPFCLLQLSITGTVWIFRKLTAPKQILSIWNYTTLKVENEPAQEAAYSSLMQNLKKRLLCRRAVEEIMGQDFCPTFGMGSEPLVLSGSLADNIR